MNKQSVKANKRIEGVFAQAVAMDNRGIKNMIHCIGENIYVVNFDYSMILRFSLRQNEARFEVPISFNANEYDSPNFAFELKDTGGEIIFHTVDKGYTRKKICQTGSITPGAKDIRKLYKKLKEKVDTTFCLFYLSEECVPLLEDDMSHVEISVESSRLILRQRNIYTGTIVEIEPSETGFFTVNKLPKNMPPIALKTKDFTSLFNIQKSLAFVPAEDFLYVKDPQKNDFDGVLALCKYDMIIDLYKGGNNDGGKESEARSSEQKANRSASKRATRTRK
ncbi:MAG: hypothetical protein BWX44_00066 [Spirochaetes bacterium ADurb.Bin001]|nr:MAG: hypothetical protein BWX44_00066 [Spirochaetes bacterium ADurb.Bin001]